MYYLNLIANMYLGNIEFKITILSNNMKSDYYNKYYAKNEVGDKFLIYLKKTESSIFKIGDIINISRRVFASRRIEK